MLPVSRSAMAAVVLLIIVGFVPFAAAIDAIPSKGGGEEKALIAFAQTLPFTLIPLAFVWWRSSLKGLSFWEGLCYISGRMMCGCANLTVIYLIPVFWVVLTLMLVHSVIGLFVGKAYTERRWLGILRWFRKHGGVTGGQQDAEEAQFSALLDSYEPAAG
ncbi:MAG: hypothetical protein ACK47B_29055 [Armatimonadota bacterium]